MDIVNKAGSYRDPASMYPSAPKFDKAASASQASKVETSAAQSEVSKPQAAKSQPIVANNPNSRAEVSGAVSSLNESVQNIQRGIEFSVDEESGRSVVKVLDRETGDVIRQIPAEDALKISRHIKEYIEARQTDGEASGQSESALGFIMQVQA